jgi:hypothetical protein
MIVADMRSIERDRPIDRVDAPHLTVNAGMPERRFPPPWSVEEHPACFAVRDHNGQKLAYVYFEDEPGRRSAAKLLTRDEARKIAVNIAKLPDLVGARSDNLSDTQPLRFSILRLVKCRRRAIGLRIIGMS